MPRIRRNNQRIRAGAGRTRREDCCCDEQPSLPGCPGLPLWWKVEFSNMPDFPTGGDGTPNSGPGPYTYNCISPATPGYPPWEICRVFIPQTGNTRIAHSKFKGACDYFNNTSWELPFAPTFPGDYRWSLPSFNIPNAQLADSPPPSSCTGGPKTFTNADVLLTAFSCPPARAPEINYLQIRVQNGLTEWASPTIPILPGTSALDLPPIVMTAPAHSNGGFCAKYQLNTSCNPTATFLQGPTCIATPNG